MTIAIASANSAVERLLVVDAHRPGTVHRLARGETLAGGKGVNVARVLNALARLPDDTFGPSEGPNVPAPCLFGFRGGATGRLFEELLRGEGIDCDLVPTAGATRVNEVLVDRSDPAGATVYNAVGPRVSASELALLDEVFTRVLGGAQALVCTGSIPPGAPEDLYAGWIARARLRGVPTVLDAHGPALAAGAAAAPDILKVNRDEAADTAGGTASRDGDAADLAARGWLAAGTRCVIVTDGAAPTRVYTGDAGFEVSVPRVRLRSAVGSGDAFCAGLVHSLLSAPDAGWARHLRVATACGASNAASETADLSAEAPPGDLLDRVTVRTSPAWWSRTGGGQD
ncbi:PfkB family carbohydrate kinase [Streptomyces sp. DW26H14]|uniref:PfkB family carbohydrate kinase n=1 Tax=Streptomyces sp. DW26H14 TaxID=3435395 RepID=UPI00403DEEB8